jgi:hypothetical protein
LGELGGIVYGVAFEELGVEAGLGFFGDVNEVDSILSHEEHDLVIITSNKAKSTHKLEFPLLFLGHPTRVVWSQFNEILFRMREWCLGAWYVINEGGLFVRNSGSRGGLDGSAQCEDGL